MRKKMFVGCIFIKNQKAYKNFSDSTIVSTDPVALACQYSDSDMDAILIFNLSNEEEDYQDTLSLMQEICDKVNVPVYGGGGIKSVEDCGNYLALGCQKIILNLGKIEGYDLLPSVSSTFGKSRIAATIASEDSISMNREKLEELVDELILIDEHALKNCLGASTLPCIVFLPEISLDKMLSIMENATVSGISGNIVNENAKNIGALKSICKDRGICVYIFEPPMPFSEFKLLSDGLMPVVVQDYLTDQVLMVAYMNEEAYLTTLRTGKMTYYSRSRKELWMKGLTSGHFQYVKQLSIDCDNDTLLAKVKQIGAACHTGNYSCFYRDLIPADASLLVNPENPLKDLYEQTNLSGEDEAELLRRLAMKVTELSLLSGTDKTETTKRKLLTEASGTLETLIHILAVNEIPLEDVYHKLK